MKARQFSGSSMVETALGHSFVSEPGEAFSMLVYGKQAGSGAEWLYSYDTAGRWTMGIESGKLHLYRGGSSGGPSFSALDWCLWLVTVESGGAIPSFYIYNFASETWEADGVEGEASVTQDDGPPGHLRLGVWNGMGSEQFEGQMAAAAYWRRALTAEEVHELPALESVEAWLGALSPDLLLLLDEASPIDQSGNGADADSTSGTSLVSASLPLPLRTGEEPGGGGEGGEVLVRVGGSLVGAKRYVKQGGILIPA